MKTCGYVSVAIIRAIKFIFPKDLDFMNMIVEITFKFYGKSLHSSYDHRIQGELLYPRHLSNCVPPNG